MEKFDVAVIGAGPGGYPAAIRCAQLGKKVAIVEREFLGGTCLNVGCIPTKTLIASAELYQAISNASEMGLKVQGVEADYAAVTARKEQVVGQLTGGVRQLLKANKVTVLSGAAAFIDRKTLAITANDEASEKIHIQADKVIIATGSTSAMPGFIPKDERIVDSRAFLDMTELPTSLTVLGGGYIGCELACMAASFGVKVTIVELLDDVLLLLDKDIRAAVKKHMTEKLGIELMTGEAMSEVAVNDKGVAAKVGESTVESDILLVSVGRRPVTDGLELNNAGIEVNENGFIGVDDRNCTKVAGIYAIGDVNGIMMLAHAATSQGICAADDACGLRPDGNESIIPGVIFTSPEVALAGITEAEAKEKGLDVTTGKYYFRGLGKALASGEIEGFVKLITDSETDQLLGAQVVGPHATDLISEAVLAIRSELTAEELGQTIHAHPTFAEIWMEAAHAVHGKSIHLPPRRR
ncbi:MAG: dihydrolipoyl dehydrogenase [Kiritimatiellia bacterium]|jgi:dihydrolipoamide dehydrogenase|nr:dihydrolipoyl dehydrogenase [Kiritimatiellia bacterium]